ncbi:class-II fumarase/aspartase family protein [Ornithinimicrobium faecis]|uniref:class-II fumarase/aspartase family protein n=1 Tax=Ornithinimicrobium faecis TaxID=2934158 RepID=UPI0021178C6C|nr:adenylosuccinate lyase family protein [Ornithinimicrobium sp. HY1745]
MSVLRSALFQDIFSTDAMRGVFSDDNLVRNWLEAEAALAEAEAANGVIPEEAAREIRSRAHTSAISQTRLREGIGASWHPLLPLIDALSEACEEPHGKYVHWGATTQDIMDTGLMLQVREGLKLVRAGMEDIYGVLVQSAQKYRSVVMAGRTHGQQGLPLTLGYKFAVWADEYHRHLSRLDELESRVNTANLSGGVGTLASLGDKAEAVRRDYFALLEMDAPNVTWHAARDRIGELLSFLSLVGMTNGKIANEVAQLQRTEIGELEEPFYDGKVGSSTMPQKRNPTASEAVYAIAHLLRATASTGQLSMLSEHERDMRLWMMEWDSVGSAFCFLSGSLHHLNWVLEGLVVREDRMAQNLELTNGLIMAESVLMELSKTLGHQGAHSIVYTVAMQAYGEGRAFGEVLREHSEVSEHIGEEELARSLDVKSYVGLSEHFVENVVAKESMVASGR